MTKELSWVQKVSRKISMALYLGRLNEEQLGRESQKWQILDEDKVADPNIDVVREAETHIIVQASLEKLSFKQRRVVEMRYDGLTLEEVGQSLGLTQERVRQIEAQSIAKMKRANNW